jgi:hypothetical protein
VTERRTSKVTASTPAHYTVVVAGEIDQSWADHFAGMTLETARPGETRLVGSLQDQAALQGILERLHGLNIPILSVSRLEESGSPGESNSGDEQANSAGKHE